MHLPNVSDRIDTTDSAVIERRDRGRDKHRYLRCLSGREGAGTLFLRKAERHMDPDSALNRLGWPETFLCTGVCNVGTWNQGMHICALSQRHAVSCESQVSRRSFVFIFVCGMLFRRAAIASRPSGASCEVTSRQVPLLIMLGIDLSGFNAAHDPICLIRGRTSSRYDLLQERRLPSEGPGQRARIVPYLRDPSHQRQGLKSLTRVVDVPQRFDAGASSLWNRKSCWATGKAAAMRTTNISIYCPTSDRGQEQPLRTPASEQPAGLHRHSPAIPPLPPYSAAPGG